MSNGGIIGPTVNPAVGTTSELITTFNAPGNFTAQQYQTQADVLVVAGGGGGAVAGAGGGAGGYRLITNHPIPSSFYNLLFADNKQVLEHLKPF
jgi:hypothetical protein